MNEMLEEMNAQPNASEGFTHKELNAYGKKYGVTCREIVDNFMGKERRVGKCRYAAVAPENPIESARKVKTAPAPKPLKAAAKKATKKAAPAPKAPKADKPAKVSKKKGKPSIADEINAELDADDLDTVEPTGAVFEYIATAEEIAEDGQEG